MRRRLAKGEKINPRSIQFTTNCGDFHSTATRRQLSSLPKLDHNYKDLAHRTSWQIHLILLPQNLAMQIDLSTHVVANLSRFL